MSHWYCIYTKPKQQDNVCKRLGSLPDIEVFNPKLSMQKIVRSKLKNVTEDLFPCYIFSRFDSKQYFHMITFTRGVRRFVGDRQGQPYIVDDTIIELIKSSMDDGVVKIGHPARLIPGHRVRITNGPFAGLTGIFLNELSSDERVMILLNTLNSQTKVDLPKCLLERI